MRAAKVQKIQLPEIERDRRISKAQDIETQRELMKKRGTLPATPAQLPVYFSCSSGVFDDKIIAKEMNESIATQLKDKTLKMGKSFRATRKIRKYDDEFDTRAFASIAEDIYIKAHSALAGRRFNELHDYVTEFCYPVSDHSYCAFKKQQNVNFGIISENVAQCRPNDSTLGIHQKLRTTASVTRKGRNTFSRRQSLRSSHSQNAVPANSRSL